MYNALDVFDIIVLLNLDSRTDRLERFVSGLKEYGFTNDWINQRIERFPAIELPNGADGCRESHMEIIRLSKERGRRNVLVLEDDCQFVGTHDHLAAFCRQLALVSWDMAYLGYNSHEPLDAVDLNLLTGKGLFSTHAIAYNNTVFDRILADHAMFNINVVDVYYRDVLQKDDGIKVLAANPILATQYASFSNITNKQETPDYILERAAQFTQHITALPMLNNVLVSICIPCYEMKGKGAEFLLQSLEIIKQQNYTNIEVVIGDQSCAGDNSIEKALCKFIGVRALKKAGNFGLVSLPKPIGAIVSVRYHQNGARNAASNTNMAIRCAQGQLIKILYQDDFLLGIDSIKKLVRAYKTMAAEWIVTGCMHTDNGTDLYRPHVPKWNPEIWKGINTISSPSVLAMTDKTVQPYFDDNLVWLVDCEMYQRLYLNNGMPCIVEEPLVVNRVWQGQLSNRIPQELKDKEYEYLRKRYDKDSFVGENGIWLIDDPHTKEHAFDLELAVTIASYAKEQGYESVVDLGCGLGDYVAFLQNEGLHSMGYDGNPNTATLTGGLCHVLDVSKKTALLSKGVNMYDMVLSLEVGEHIPAEFEDNFIYNLTENAGQGIILSWAIEGQGGLGHVNCRNNDYIIGRIEAQGFAYDGAASQRLRVAATLPWFKDTLMVFKETRQRNSKHLAL